MGKDYKDQVLISQVESAKWKKEDVAIAENCFQNQNLKTIKFMVLYVKIVITR